jgi:hypothetical protein
MYCTVCNNYIKTRTRIEITAEEEPSPTTLGNCIDLVRLG